MEIKKYVSQVVEDPKVDDEVDENEWTREQNEDLEESYRDSQERSITPIANGY